MKRPRLRREPPHPTRLRPATAVAAGGGHPPSHPTAHRFDEREAKLPQWAMQLIGRLRMDLDTVIRERDVWTSGKGPGPFFLRHYSSDGIHDRVVPADSLWFRSGGTELHMRAKDGQLDIYGHGDNHTIAVAPVSGNVVRIWQPGRRVWQPGRGK